MLSVALVDDVAMQALNAQWRGRDRPTDVLAFAQREGEAQHDATLLGDVVISIPTAVRQASLRGRTLESEITELLVHGILHLLGYDHERSPAEARRMYARTREVLASLGPLAADTGTRAARAGTRPRSRSPRSRRGAGTR